MTPGEIIAYYERMTDEAVARQQGAYRASYHGSWLRYSRQDNLQVAFEEGYQIMRAAMEADPSIVRSLFHEKIAERMKEWLVLAAERLDGSGIPVYLMPGNDDDFEIDPLLESSTYCRNVNEQVVDLTPWHQLVSMGWSSPTPWSTPRELPEEDFLDRLSGLMRGVRDARKTVMMTHVPPYDSGLDTAPLLSPDLRPTVTAGWRESTRYSRP